MPVQRLLLLLLMMVHAVSIDGAQVTPAPHLELAVDPSAMEVGTKITLRIRYVNVGMPHATIAVDPPGLVHFDPPLDQPCKWGQHPNNCTLITFRADAPGTVTFRAEATGEIFSDVCSCWHWGHGSGAVTVTISGTRTFLPLVPQP